MTAEPERILVVDDELGMREGCRKILTSEGYQVETAPDGLAGLETFNEKGPFAAALVDLKMPRMGGIELVQRLRESDEDIVIFVITAYAAIDTAVEATRRGAYGYIPKPFTPDEVLLPVRNGLERRALALEAKRLRQEREDRLLEIALERSKSSTIIGCMADGVLVINRDRQTVLRNAAMTRILPSCAALPLPSPLNAIEHAELKELIEEALKGGPGPVIAMKEITLDKCTYMANASPLLEPGGGVMGAVAVLRDITELKKLETAKSMFISMVAHEVKSPLAAIESQLTTVLSGVVDDAPDKRTGMVNRALIRAQGLRSMVSDLLNLTAMETGNFIVKRTPIEIHRILIEAIDAQREKAESKHITVQYEAAPDAERARVLADRDSLFIIFTNLLDNAVKYTPEGGRVSARLGHEAGFVNVAVQDTGIGMSLDEAEKVFDEFYRAKNDYTIHVSGTGLGLTLVRRLLAMHDGTIRLDTAPRAGSTFTVRMPQAG